MNDRVDGLKFNICDLKTKMSHRLNRQVLNLEEQMEETIEWWRLIRPVSYPCQFWAVHLRKLSMTDIKDDIVLQLRSFLHDRVRFWFEAMSLTKELDIASVFLQFATRWGKPV